MADDSDGAAWAIFEDEVEGMGDSAAEGVDRFGFGNEAEFELSEPIKSADIEAGFDFFPAQAGPDAEVDFAQAGDEDGQFILFGDEFGESLLDAAHGAGIDGLEGKTLEIIGESDGLFEAERGEFHINAPAEDLVVTRLDFPMSNEDQAGGGFHNALGQREPGGSNFWRLQGQLLHRD